MAKTVRASFITTHQALLAAWAITATAAVWAALQAVDGVTLKQAVNAWAAASGTDERPASPTPKPFAGPNGAFRATLVLLGVALLLLGAASVLSRLVPTWLGVLLALGGLLSLVVGISVSYAGFQSAFQDAVTIAFQLVALAVGIGLLVAGRRAQRQNLASNP